MNSLSTSAFGPVAFSLGLLLVMASAFPCRTPAGEDSKDDATSNTPPVTISDNTIELMKFIIEQISALKKEVCEKFDKCESISEALAGNNMNLPKIRTNDGCFSSECNWETCLTRVVTGLLEFQIYLDYVEDNFEGDKEKVRVVQRSIKALVLILKQVKNPVTTPNPTTNASLLSKLQPQSEWLRNTRINLILQNLDIFMQFSLRAIRNMKSGDSSSL
ncbi:PREDICTED: interleukin-6-like [Elephantulus edwardii]|uniref:interleukin-6-like n=1 Tax=Elephantulus edwardii TaxID=28737 RepID=UPI0003F0950E|nr:PREDICTED: interleukin-6-like [Elephantulus edwardii]